MAIIVTVAAVIAALAIWSPAFALPFLHVSGDSDGDHIVDASDAYPAAYCDTAHADVNGNGTVFSDDFTGYNTAFGQEPAANPLRDQNHNDAIDYLDFLIVASHATHTVSANCGPIADATPITGAGAFAGPAIILSAPTLLTGSEGSVSPFITSSGSTDPQRAHYIRISFDETVVQWASDTNSHPDITSCFPTVVDNADNAPGPDGSASVRCSRTNFPPIMTSSYVGLLETFTFNVVGAGDPAFCIETFASAGALRGSFTIGSDIAPQSNSISASCGFTSLDSDGDGCADVQEFNPQPLAGGRRNPQLVWDFYDVNGTQKVDGADIGLVRSKFNQDFPAYDRSPGAAQWAPGPPDGIVNGIDIGLVRASFNHSCTGA